MHFSAVRFTFDIAIKVTVVTVSSHIKVTVVTVSSHIKVTVVTVLSHIKVTVVMPYLSQLVQIHNCTSQPCVTGHAMCCQGGGHGKRLGQPLECVQLIQLMSHTHTAVSVAMNGS